MIKNRFLGSSALIIGSSIGGGILSLPLITAACGPILAILLLTLCWWVMYQSAKNVFVLCHQRKAGVDFTTIISEKLSPFTHFLFILFYLLLLYSLLSAYLVQGGELTQLLLSYSVGESGLLLNKFLFITTFGFFIYSISFADKINKLFLTIKLILFFSLCFFLAFYNQVNQFIVFPISVYAVVYALPTLIISFGFHNIIPTIYSYQQGDYLKTEGAIFYSGLFILIIYIIWILLCFLVIPVDEFYKIFLKGNRTDDFVRVVARRAEKEIVKDAVFLFVNFSVVTSFLGVGLSLKHYISDVCQSYKIRINSIILFFLVFLVSLAFNLLYPDGFITALQYASICAVVIFMWIPLYIKGLRKKPDYLILLFGAIVVAFQVCNLYFKFNPFK